VVGCAVLLVNIEGDGVEYTYRVEAGTALKAGSCQLPHSALHAVFHYEIVRRFDYVQKAIHLGINERRPSCCELWVLDRKIVAHPQ